jgi:putative peptidoglycan lipid II flippase
MNYQESLEAHQTVVNKASSVSFATLLSRILGYIRDMLIANFFGATMFADSFFVAYRIPNLLRRLLGEGSLSTSFIPVYTEYLTTKNKDESTKLIRVILGAFGILFVLLTIAGIIFAPQIVTIIAPGFARIPEKFNLTVYLTRIMFPFLMAIGLGAIMLGILNSWRMFFIPAIAPVMLSISEILFILLICPMLDLPISGLAVGVVAGGFAQLMFQLVPVIKKLKIVLPVIDLKHPGLQKVGRLMLPAILGLSIMQINSFVDTICATLLKEGSVTHLYYGNRLVQLPLALFGTAIATVTLPMMSENAAKNQMQKLKDTFSFSLRTISFLIMPATVGLIIFGQPIIKLLFERGEFLTKDTNATAWVLSFYATGLIFYAGVKVAASAFYSMQDTKTPAIIASIAMVLNVILNILVVTVASIKTTFQAGGLAFATAIASAFNFLLLIIVFRKQKGLIGGRAITQSVAKHIVASLIMGAGIYQLNIYTELWSVYIKTPFVIIAAAFIYIVMGHILSIPELKQIRNYFNR